MDDDYFDNAPQGGWSARSHRVRSPSARAAIIERNEVSYRLAEKRDEKARRAREQVGSLGSVGYAFLAAVEAKKVAA